MKQMIISISREYGSAGHEIGEKLAKRLGLTLYDRVMLDEIAKEQGVNPALMYKYDEKPVRFNLPKALGNLTGSPEDVVADLQFSYILKKAESGESFVIIGRCAEEVLKSNPNLTAVFIRGEIHERENRIMAIHDIGREQARNMIEANDKKREKYHNRYCENAWGLAESYDICINSSKLGVDKTVTLLMDYLKHRFK